MRAVIVTGAAVLVGAAVGVALMVALSPPGGAVTDQTPCMTVVLDYEGPDAGAVGVYVAARGARTVDDLVHSCTDHPDDTAGTAVRRLGHAGAPTN